MFNRVIPGRTEAFFRLKNNYERSGLYNDNGGWPWGIGPSIHILNTIRS